MPRALLAAALACLVIAAPAAASPVLVYDNGHVTKADDPALPPASADPLSAEAHECGPGTEGARPPGARPLQHIRRLVFTVCHLRDSRSRSPLRVVERLGHSLAHDVQAEAFDQVGEAGGACCACGELRA